MKLNNGSNYNVARIERRSLLYILYVIIIAVLIVGIALAFKPKSQEPPKKPITTSNSSSSQNPAGLSVSSDSNGAINQTAPIPNSQTQSSSSSTSSSNSNNTSTNKQTAGQTLSNTGPGDNIALFIGASIVGTLIYRRKLLKNVLR